MYNLLFVFILPSSFEQVVVLLCFTFLRSFYTWSYCSVSCQIPPMQPCRSCYFSSYYIPPMQRLLFSFSSSSSHAEVFIFAYSSYFAFHAKEFVLVHFTFLECRSCYFRSCHLPPMLKLFFWFMSPSLHAEVFILVYFTSLLCRICYFRSFQLLPMQSMLFWFMLFSSHAEVVIFVRFTFLPWRSFYSCSFHFPTM